MATAQQLWREQYKALYVSPELHKQLKLAAVEEDLELKKLTEDIVRAFLADRQIKPQAAHTGGTPTT